MGVQVHFYNELTMDIFFYKIGHVASTLLSKDQARTEVYLTTRPDILTYTFRGSAYFMNKYNIIFS